MKLILSFLSSGFATWLKSQDKNLNTLRTKSAFEVKQKAFVIISKGLPVAKNCLRSESPPLRKNLINLKPSTSFLMEHMQLTDQFPASVKWSWIYFFIYLTLKVYLEVHTSFTPQSCCKSVHYVSYYKTTVGTTVLKNIKKHSHKNHKFHALFFGVKYRHEE